MSRSWFQLSAIPESIVTGSLYLAGEYAIRDIPFKHKSIERFGESAVASFISAPISEALWSALLPQAQRSAHPQLLHDVTSGLLFASADMYFKYSDQSFLYKFLLQAGAEAVSENVISLFGFEAS
jgi:hypothetical protein